MSETNKTEMLLRLGVFGTFFGHGILALGTKASWIPYLTVVGFSEPTARILIPIIGVMDMLVAIITLFRPIRWVLIWATIWAFATALIRPVTDYQMIYASGKGVFGAITGSSVWDFVERTANWVVPLVLLKIGNFGKK